MTTPAAIDKHRISSLPFSMMADSTVMTEPNGPISAITTNIRYHPTLAKPEVKNEANIDSRKIDQLKKFVFVSTIASEHTPSTSVFIEIQTELNITSEKGVQTQLNLSMAEIETQTGTETPECFTWKANSCTSVETSKPNQVKEDTSSIVAEQTLSPEIAQEDTSSLTLPTAGEAGGGETPTASIKYYLLLARFIGENICEKLRDLEKELGVVITKKEENKYFRSFTVQGDPSSVDKAKEIVVKMFPRRMLYTLEAFLERWEEMMKTPNRPIHPDRSDSETQLLVDRYMKKHANDVAKNTDA